MMDLPSSSAIYPASSLLGHFSANEANLWLKWIGSYHYLFVHFTIALLTMTCVAEFFAWWKKNMRYSFAATFLLQSAILLTIPTIATGLFLENSGMAEEMGATLEWHETLAYITFSFSILTLFLKSLVNWRVGYLSCLLILFILVMATAHLGGMMAFEGFDLFPPLFHP